MKFPPRWFSLLFATSDKEARGIIALSFLIVIMILVRMIVSCSPDSPAIPYSIEYLDSISNAMDQAYEKSHHKFNPPSEDFDPNEINPQQWMAMGLDSIVSQRVNKYLEKGGRFKNPSDIKKIYGMPDWFSDSVLPYVVIIPVVDPIDTQSQLEAHMPVYEAPQPIDLNLSDSAGLTMIRGVGPVFSGRIIRYRKKLGGFVSVRQLQEVYGIDSSKFAGIESQVYLDTTISPVKKLNINVDEFKVLLRHPYLNYEQVKALINFRKQHEIIRKRDFMNFPFLSKRQKLRIIPYLNFSMSG